METKYTNQHTNRAARVQEGVNPVPADPNTVQPEVTQASTENRSHDADGRLKG
jgi:hypothetical protein